jgi:tRNA (uracil-5-)-methyltransferase TRM9
MKGSVMERLRKINYEFYTGHGREFASTRRRLQPGVRRLVETLRGEESILDLGCGNGPLARELARRGHRGAYLGIDFSAELLRQAENAVSGLSARFVRADLVELARPRVSEPSLESGHPPADSSARTEAEGAIGQAPWMIAAAFAVLHHIPAREQRQQVLGAVRGWMHAEGRLFLSNWQFLEHARMGTRVQRWSTAGVDASDLDSNDYLLDWRHGAPGLRYVHQFGEAELGELAAASGFAVIETFYSDGADHRSGLYQVWQPETSAARR